MSIRTRRFALAVTVARVAVSASVALLAGCGQMDEEIPSSEIAVCSDVAVHVWVVVNTGTETDPVNNNVDQDVHAGGHDRVPFDNANGCDTVAAAFGSRAEFGVPGLNGGQRFPVTAPADKKHALVVRFTKHADGTVTATQETVASPYV